MKSIKPQEFVLLAAIIAGLFGVYVLATVLESRQTDVTAEIEANELSLQGENLKGYAFGFEGLLADWYWMRSLQYIGDKLYKARDQQIDLDNLKTLDPKLLYPLLDNATTLDPNFMAAYSYGANVLPAIDRDQAIEFAKKGIASNPKEWTLYHQLGYIYWKLGRFKDASSVYAKGAGIKGAPGWMRVMSARMDTEGGSRKTAREIYTRLKDAADSKTRITAEIRLAELDSLDERDVLDRELSKFEEKEGRCPKSWREVIPQLKDIKPVEGKKFRVDSELNVVDPTDAPYLIETKSCTARVDFSKSKLPRN